MGLASMPSLTEWECLVGSEGRDRNRQRNDIAVASLQFPVPLPFLVFFSFLLPFNVFYPWEVHLFMLFVCIYSYLLNVYIM